MNRRTFNAMTLASLVPSWWLRKEVAPQMLDLTAFCTEHGHIRYEMSRPFEQAGFACATDGRVAVRALPRLCPTRDDGDEVRLPPIDKLLWPGDDVAGWRPIGAMTRELRGEKWQWRPGCPTCDGKGRIGTDVRDCDCVSDVGDFDWHDGEFECAKCRGCEYVGGQSCPECNGSGEVDYVMRLDGGVYAPAYVAKLSRLPGVEAKVGESVVYPGRKPAELVPLLHVRFDGGCGLLMPMYE